MFLIFQGTALERLFSNQLGYKQMQHKILNAKYCVYNSSCTADNPVKQLLSFHRYKGSAPEVAGVTFSDSDSYV